MSRLTLAPIFVEIDALFKVIQGSVLLVDQQKAAFSRFLSALWGPLPVHEMEAEERTSIKEGSFSISLKAVEYYLKSCGSATTLHRSAELV